MPADQARRRADQSLLIAMLYGTRPVSIDTVMAPNVGPFPIVLDGFESKIRAVSFSLCMSRFSSDGNTNKVHRLAYGTRGLSGEADRQSPLGLQ